MAVLVTAIHVFSFVVKRDVGGRNKSGHDSVAALAYFFGWKYFCRYFGSGAPCPFWIGIR